MAFSEKDLRLVRKTYESKDEKSMDRIRLGNHFVDDFIFEDHQAADIPINALRVIFNIISIISNEQFRPEDRPKQLSLLMKNLRLKTTYLRPSKSETVKFLPVVPPNKW